MLSDRFDLCAIGNVCIDLITKVPDDFLQFHGLVKSRNNPIDGQKLETMLADLPTDILTLPGGVGANVAHVVAALGGRAAFQGKRGKDKAGDICAADFQRQGIACHLAIEPNPLLGSSKIMCFSSPDGDRSFASYDGAAKTLVPEDLDYDLISASNILYLDCYCLLAGRSRDTFLEAIRTSHQSGNLCIINPCDPSVCKAHEQTFSILLANVDGIICNIDEAQTLFTDLPAMEMAHFMSDRFRVGALTNGSQGAWVFRDRDIVFIPPPDTSLLKEIDSNGAGDHFSAGYLYGLQCGMGLEQAGTLARRTAGDCLGHAGARPLGSLKHLLAGLS